MRSENIILKDDLASLLEGLEKVKRESKDVVQNLNLKSTILILQIFLVI